jgi:hypothetical protein
MSPWPLLLLLTAVLNLALFVMVRGRWDRLVPLLALAAVAGAATGTAVGGRVGIDVLRIGDFSFLAASVTAQLAMIAAVLLTTLGPARRAE